MSRRETLERRLHDAPDDTFLNYTYALELAKTGDVDAAQAVLEKVRRLDPDYVPAFFQEGQLLAGAGRVEQAREVLRAGIAVAGRIGDAHALREMTEFLEQI